MKGKVLGFDELTNVGKISGFDGKRYNFTKEAWKSENTPVRHLEVDFDIQGESAIDVYCLSPPAAGLNQSLKPHRGTLVLVFGILGLFACGIFSVLAWIFGNQDLKNMQEGLMDTSGMSITKAGKVMGIIGVSLWFVFILAAISVGLYEYFYY
jgi:hypothetical protein